MARDLLRGDDSVLVHEGTATRTLRQWDRIAARLVSSDGKTILAGGLLAYSRGACEDLATNLYKVLRKRRGKAEFPKVDTQTLHEVCFPLAKGVMQKKVADTLVLALRPATGKPVILELAERAGEWSRAQGWTR